MQTLDEFRTAIQAANTGYLNLLLVIVAPTLLGYLVHYRAPHLSPFRLKVPKLTIRRGAFLSRYPDWLLLVAVGLLVRLPRMTEVMWYDETFSAAIARVPLERLPVAIMGDVHPPLNYLLQWFTVNVLGDSAIALRLPSLLAGIALILLMYQLTRALGLSRRAARAAGLMTALMPAAIYYSNEARAYALLACLVLVMVIAVLKNKPRWYWIAGALIPWTHNIGFIYVGVIGLTALLYRPKRRWFRAVVASGIGGAVWLPAMLIQSVDVANGFWLWQLDLGGMFKHVTSMTVSNRLDIPYLIPVYALLIGLLVVSLLELRYTKRWLVWLALVAGVPLALAVVSVVWRPVYLERALLPAGLALIVPIAWLASERRAARLASVLLIGISLTGFFAPSGAKYDTTQVFDQCSGADFIFYTSPSTAIMGQTYAPPGADQLLWGQANDLSQTLPDDAKATLGLHSWDQLDRLAGDICIPTQVNPMVSDHETEFLTAALAGLDVTTYETVVNDTFAFVVYRFQQ